MTNTMAHSDEHIHSALDQKQAIMITVCEVVDSNPATEENIPTPPPKSPRRALSKRYSFVPTSQQTTPPTALHPALRPTSVLSRTSSSAESRSTSGQSYDSMSTASRPSTSWTIGREYASMKPGTLPNSDWTTGLSYDEMRGKSVVGKEIRPEKKKKRWLKAYKEELKDNFRAMDRAMWV